MVVPSSDQHTHYIVTPYMVAPPGDSYSAQHFLRLYCFQKATVCFAAAAYWMCADVHLVNEMLKNTSGQNQDHTAFGLTKSNQHPQVTTGNVSIHYYTCILQCNVGHSAGVIY